MSPMEKMARALSDHFGCEWETMRDADREMIRGYVRAALLAIREPDREVTQAMDAESYPDSGSYSRWQAGIDAILNQEPRS